MNLYDLNVNDRCIIKELPNDIDLLQALGLRKDLKVKVSNKQPFGGPIILMNGTRNLAIGRKVADRIKVERCDFYGD